MIRITTNNTSARMPNGPFRNATMLNFDKAVAVFVGAAAPARLAEPGAADPGDPPNDTPPNVPELGEPAPLAMLPVFVGPPVTGLGWVMFDGGDGGPCKPPADVGPHTPALQPLFTVTGAVVIGGAPAIGDAPHAAFTSCTLKNCWSVSPWLFAYAVSAARSAN
jgi:hypothetical protein